MKANEFRIGNLIDYKGKTYRICGTSEDFPFLDTIEYGAGVVEWKDLDGTPITEERLLKFGFEKTMAWTYSINLQGNFNLVYYLGEKGWSIGFKDYSDFSNHIYVHQLQNLYFALTGKELTIKE
jgi:hypothetical protein